MSVFPDSATEIARALVADFRGRGLHLATAESCTGGLIAACVTEIPGSSDIFVGGFVTYANEMKMRAIGVPEELLRDFGAVSEEVSRAMAEGAVRASGADVAVSATGIAGPGGATPAKPVGLVHVGAARKGAATLHERHVFSGDRTSVRLAAVAAALKLARQIAA